MRKSVLFVAIAALVAIASMPLEVHAQPPQWQIFDGKLFVNVNVGIQVGDNDLSRHTTFPLYDENAEVDVNQTINNGAFFEFGAAWKFPQVHKNFGAGMVYSFLSNSGPGTISGTLPHPLFFDQPRSFSAGADDLSHSEQALHFQAIYFMPYTDKIDFAFSFGPSIFIVKQELIRSVAFSEIPPNFNSVNIDSVDIVNPRDSGWGFNLGADMIYAYKPSIGLGAIIRYTHGGVTFNLSDTQEAKVNAGGFQLGGGVRLRF
jgi:hypothetical protein